ncbi:hypothetical protein CsSME_00024564 [Camellia sinensis var. sinensis]
MVVHPLQPPSSTTATFTNHHRHLCSPITVATFVHQPSPPFSSVAVNVITTTTTVIIIVQRSPPPPPSSYTRHYHRPFTTGIDLHSTIMNPPPSFTNHINHHRSTLHISDLHFIIADPSIQF